MADNWSATTIKALIISMLFSRTFYRISGFRKNREIRFTLQFYRDLYVKDEDLEKSFDSIEEERDGWVLGKTYTPMLRVVFFIKVLSYSLFL